MKKILLITYDLCVGGAQQHMVLFANFLIKENWNVTLINLSLNNDLKYRLDDRVNLINLPRGKNFDLKPRIKIKEILIKEKIQIIFCNGLFCYLFLNNKATKDKNYKISIIFHVTAYSNKYLYYKDLIVRLLLKKNVKLIGTAQNQINRLSKTLFIRKNRFALVYNGVQTDLFNASCKNNYNLSAIREQLDISPDTFVIIQTARFDQEKNHEMAVEVVKELKNNLVPNVVILFVGGNNEVREKSIRELVIQNGLEANVRFLGVQKDVKPYLYISDVFILTSKSVETFSNAALEAMSCGIPCVLTNVGGAPEMIKNGYNGFVTPVNKVQDFALKLNEIYRGNLYWDEKQISQNISVFFDSKHTNGQLTAAITN